VFGIEGEGDNAGRIEMVGAGEHSIGSCKFSENSGYHTLWAYLEEAWSGVKPGDSGNMDNSLEAVLRVRDP
jgi:hypothetical protein